MKSRRPYAAFTLLELLTVIAIIGIIAAMVAPTLSHFRKGDAMLAATRQMLDAVARGRQLAISGHTTVYMVFVPTNFWADPAYTGNARLTAEDKAAAVNLMGKQLVGYNYISLRSVGDQPGQGHPKYLSAWQALPETSFVALWKFTTPRPPFPATVVITNAPVPGNSGFSVWGFDYATNLPFPRAETLPCVPPPGAPYGPYVRLPYIAFNYLGQIVSPDPPQNGEHCEFIPLAHGSVLFAKDANKVPIPASPVVQESPPNNSVTDYQLIRVDYLTGRARLERLEIR